MKQVGLEIIDLKRRRTEESNTFGPIIQREGDVVMTNSHEIENLASKNGTRAGAAWQYRLAP